MKRSILAAAALAVALGAGSSAAAGSLPTLTLALTPKTVAVSGSESSGAVQVVTTLSGERSDDPTLFLLRPGVSAAQFAAVVSKLHPNSAFDAIDPYASIVYDGVAAAGARNVGETWLAPGNYIAGGNGSGFATFTVTASAHPALLPAPQAEIDAIDFAFRGADTLRDGELVRFKNDGYLIHMFLFAQARSLADARKATSLLLAGRGPAALRAYGTGVHGMFAGPLSHAELQQEVIDEPPGFYVIACGMNAQDGREHYQLGMFRIIRILR